MPPGYVCYRNHSTSVCDVYLLVGVKLRKCVPVCHGPTNLL
eukprot:XP_001704006.1 Hypothetical protein GL50803_35595 [Giardia lamblia ATCC 50803]